MAGRDDSDVVIVGAGPAGCAAAIAAASAGLSVTLLTGATRIGRIRPGEALHPGIEPLLLQLGMGDALRRANFPRHTGIDVVDATGAHRQAFGADSDGPWKGYQAWRETFDSLLLARAQACGVTLAHDTQARTLARSPDGRPCAVLTDTDRLGAHTIVDATGSRGWLRRQLDLPTLQHSPRLIAWVAYAVRHRTDLPRFTYRKDGWTWTAPVRVDLEQWVRLRYDTTRLDEPGLAAWQACDALLQAPGGHDVSWVETAEPAGPGYYLAGDAAVSLDPSSSHGVLRAIMSGMMTAHAIRRVHDRELDEADAAGKYVQWLRAWYRHDRHALAARGLSPQPMAD